MKNPIPFFVLLILFSSSCTVGKKTTVKADELQGNWQLNYISGTRIAFDGLYPIKKPEIMFDTATNQASGNSSCNGFGCEYTKTGNNIKFGDPIGTFIACDGQGEQSFYNMLKKVNKYSINNATLTFLIDDVEVMRFSKQ